MAHRKRSGGARPYPGTLLGLRGEIGKTLLFEVVGDSRGPLWGSGPYTLDSNLGAAAVHAGLLKVGEKGKVEISVLDTSAWPLFEGDLRNGVRSDPWGAYPTGFWFPRLGKPPRPKAAARPKKARPSPSFILRPKRRAPAPVARSWLRLEKWLKKEAPEVLASLKPGCSASALAGFEKRTGLSLPTDVRDSFMIHNGQEPCAAGPILGDRLGSLEEVGTSLARWRKICWSYGTPSYMRASQTFPAGAIRSDAASRDWVAFGPCCNGHYGIDLEPGPAGLRGQVISFGDLHNRENVLALSWAHFLEDIADELESGSIVIHRPYGSACFTRARLLERSCMDGGFYCYLKDWAEAKLPNDFKAAPARPGAVACAAGVGDEVQVNWQGRWWPARVLRRKKGRHFIRYDGYDESWDEWVGGERIRQPRKGKAELCAGTLQGLEGKVGQTFSFEVMGSSQGLVWGTDTYTLDSDLGTAAVHAGVLEAGEKGKVEVTILDTAARPAFAGSERNLVRSRDWGRFSTGFRFGGTGRRPKRGMAARSQSAAERAGLIARPHSRKIAPVRVSWRRIEAWLLANAPEVAALLAPGASPADLAAFESEMKVSLPKDVRESFLIHNGQTEGDCPAGAILGEPLLPLEEARQLLHFDRGMHAEYGDRREESFDEDYASSYPPGAIRSGSVHPNWIFLCCVDGNGLGIDLSPGPKGKQGQVINFGRDESRDKRVLALSWAQLLEDVADELEAGNVGVHRKTPGSVAFIRPGHPHDSFHSFFKEWSSAKLPAAFQHSKPR